MKKIISLLIVLSMALSCFCSATAKEEYTDLISVLKEKVADITYDNYYLKYDSEDSFDDLKLNVLYEHDGKTFFNFSCKEMTKGYSEHFGYAFIENYTYSFFAQSQIFVYAPDTYDKLMDLSAACFYGAVTDCEMRYLVDNCSYPKDATLCPPEWEITKGDDESRSLLFSALPIEYRLYDEDGNEYVKTKTYYSNDDIIVIRAMMNSEFICDCCNEYTLGNYYFSGSPDNDIMVISKAEGNARYLQTAYKENLINDDILEYLSAHCFKNNIYIPYLMYKEPELTTETESEFPVIKTYKVQSNNEKYGTTDPCGKIVVYDYGDTDTELPQTLTATAKAQHTFLCWLENGEFLSDKPIVSVTTPKKNGTYTAIFRPTIDVTGDVNGDEKLDIQDIALIRSNIIGKTKLFQKRRLLGDINGDAVIDILDVVIARDSVINSRELPVLSDDERAINAAKRKAAEKVKDISDFEFFIHSKSSSIITVEGRRIENGVQVDDYVLVQICSDDFIPNGAIYHCINGVYVK